ncbi:hypothetical protein [Sphingomonas sp.]|jgi:hypothetical protein|uniref:hypothetical protein n=1 Tax=Sphingomonas sp. TaxID=28214 RepID=UPI002DB700C4|nr:hypothetical protein [Sphingomonas sp.]HEU4968081.1 hypothetical protein [Sphingomonas sp.]
MGYAEDKRVHDSIELVGMRAQATTVGLIQLTIELHRANLLDQPAIDRIKEAIANEISLNRPKSVSAENFDEHLRERLDRLFSGEDPVGQVTPETIGPQD